MPSPEREDERKNRVRAKQRELQARFNELVADVRAGGRVAREQLTSRVRSRVHDWLKRT
jgi:hypothetical protein